MKKLFAFLAALFRRVPADKDLKAHVTALFPDAIVATDLLPASNINVSVVVLPGTEAGFPVSLSSYMQGGDGVLTIVVSGGAANTIARALGLESFIPDSVRKYLVDMLKATGVVARIASINSGQSALVISLVEVAAPVIVNALESALDGFDGCVAVR